MAELYPRSGCLPGGLHSIAGSTRARNAQYAGLMIVGFDIGGTKALGLLIDPSTGSIVDRGRASSAGKGPVLLATILSIISDLEDRNETRVDAVGLGVAGLAHRSGVVRYSPNLPDLIEFPIGPELEQALNVPVTVGNDATAGTWAEAKFGAGRNVSDFVFVALGTGIGTGFVVDGRLMTGANGFAGEAGHMVVDAHGPAHLTGQQGPWEYFASGSALGRMGREAAQVGGFVRGVELADSVDSITGYHVAEALIEGDKQSAVIFDDFCREVALGTANLVLIFDPGRIVIGGGLTNIGEPLRAGVDRWLTELLLGAEHRPPVEVVLAELGSDASALGAGLLAAELVAG
jgi:glucokinase